MVNCADCAGTTGICSVGPSSDVVQPSVGLRSRNDQSSGRNTPIDATRGEVRTADR